MSTVASPIAQRASLLGLPLELREQIYYYYFTADGGYVSDGDKLLQASGQAVQISLMLACRSIASETQHLPFTLNTITFSTIYRPDWRERVLVLSQIAKYHIYLLLAMVLRLRRLLTPDMYEEPSPEYSQYMPIVMARVASFRLWVDQRTDLSLDEKDMDAIKVALGFRKCSSLWAGSPAMRLQADDSTVSLKRTKIYLLRQLANKHPSEFSQAIEEILPGWNDSHSKDEFFGLGFDSWDMPTQSELKRMVDLMQNTRCWHNRDAWYRLTFDRPHNGSKYRFRLKYYFSATAQAIKFLGQLSQQQRLSIRRLILKEDQHAAAFPESHMIGMIPFCRENSKLHVEHRINLWRNIVAKGNERIDPVHLLRSRRTSLSQQYLRQILHETEPEVVGETFIGFIMHLLEALKEGLPADSYSLIVGGYPDLNRATEIFSVSLKPYITWLTAHTDCVAYGLIAPTGHHDYPFPTRTSAQGIAPVSERSAIIQCDFTLDQPWQWETIYNEYQLSRASTLHELWIMSLDFVSKYLDVTTNLLDWREVLRESCEIEELSEGFLTEPYDPFYVA
ncbi:hypothetical protein FMUND_12048 [Fusarium mundagurra]|uniref:Uncharacterized protein n=1 Tax=Fusarium mundagurra TaxID=1567541 RepID=A0A8H5Y4B7_9HYPO|nr:hypothetical protein FMUND_12048 [Fusarium mundagurra]